MSSNEENKQEVRSSRNENDLVIRDGFPALKRRDGKGPLISGDEPLPREPFAAYKQALDISNLQSMQQDCAQVFTARTRDDQAAYSAGCTYFIPCEMKPRCALEGLALQIFRSHTKGLEGMYNPQSSGAEWWTLCLDSTKSERASDADDADDEEDEDDQDEVGMHFDADYGLEAQMPNMLLHPRVATVTYLSSVGAPTLVLDKHSPPPSDPERKSLNGDVQRAWLSGPLLGKHIAFDGRLLHGAPALFFPGTTVAEGQEPASKRPKLEDGSPPAPEKRITFLVNVWLNHCPLDAELLDDETLAQLVTPWEAPVEKEGAALKSDDSYKPPFEWKNPDQIDSTEKVALKVSKEDPAGSDEVVICDRIVTISYGPTMKELHAASSKTVEGASVELELGKRALSLEVGDEVQEEEEEEGDDDDGKQEA